MCYWNNCHSKFKIIYYHFTLQNTISIKVQTAIYA